MVVFEGEVCGFFCVWGGDSEGLNVVGDSHCVHGNGPIEEGIDSRIRCAHIESERRHSECLMVHVSIRRHPRFTHLSPFIPCDLTQKEDHAHSNLCDPLTESPSKSSISVLHPISVNRRFLHYA